MNKKNVLMISVVILSIAMLPQLEAQLGSKDSVSQGDFLDLYEPWCISGTLRLDWSVYPWHTVRFWDCAGFIICSNNTVLDLNGHTVMYKVTQLGPGFTGVEALGRSGVTIRNGTIIDFQYGIWAEQSNEVNIRFINVSASGKNGIWTRNCRNVNVESNYVSGSGDVAVGTDNSFAISILDNTVSDNDKEGIYLRDSTHNTVEGNIVSKNNYGIYLYNCKNNTISTNTIMSPRNVGIYMDKTERNVFGNNTISDTSKGMEVRGSSGNIIYHNNFINNTKNVECTESNDSWDGGYGLVGDICYGGNYWEEYIGDDKFSGRSQTVPGSDGIADAPYIIDENNRDNYPLMNPCGMLVEHDSTWRLFDPEAGWQDVVCQIAIFTNSSITDFNFSKAQAEISFTATNGNFCKVIVPNGALDDAFIVMIDDSPAASILSWDANHHFIYFSLTSGDHRIRIKGETVTRLVSDVNGDGEVNILDIFLVAKDFGKKIG